MGKLTDGLKTKTSSTTTIREEQKREPKPADAEIRDQTVTTETEEIENGYLITKRYDGTYWKDKANNDYNYFNYSKKWFSKVDPLTIKINDKGLASAFDDDSDGD